MSLAYTNDLFSISASEYNVSYWIETTCERKLLDRDYLWTSSVNTNTLAKMKTVIISRVSLINPSSHNQKHFHQKH